MSKQYNKDDKVVVFWQGKAVGGRIQEEVHKDYYRIKLSTGETCLRYAVDIIQF